MYVTEKVINTVNESAFSRAAPIKWKPNTTPKKWFPRMFISESFGLWKCSFLSSRGM